MMGPLCIGGVCPLKELCRSWRRPTRYRSERPVDAYPGDGNTCECFDPVAVDRPEPLMSVQKAQRREDSPRWKVR